MTLNKSIFYKSKFYTFSVIGILILRLILNGIIPLYDKTEARYAEIARIMAETNNWITLQIDYNIPFWAKPPLSTWLSALSIKLFGINEFAVRLPYFLLSLILIVLLGFFAKQKKLPFFLPGFILLTLPEFLLHVGVVSTDMALSFCVTLIMLSFWKSISQEKTSYWNYLFFVAMGLGLLAKGPIAIILTMPPIIIWSLIFKEHLKVIKKIPWISGAVITALIAFPWYYLAELKTKGFIDYFIVGEHFKRFFDSSWTGDKYGFPKKQPLGIIWLFLLLLSLPWIQLIALKLWKFRAELKKNKWLVFLCLWLLWTPLFFTISSSLIHPYILPVMVPIVLLTVHFWNSIKHKKRIVGISLIFPFIVLIFMGIVLVDNNLEKIENTDKFLIQDQLNNNIELFYLGEKSYSSQFYSRGTIKSISYEALKIRLKEDKPLKIIIPNKLLETINFSEIKRLKLVNSNSKKNLYTSESSVRLNDY